MSKAKFEIPATKVVFDEKDKDEILSRIDECLTTGMLSQGKYVGQFEKKSTGLILVATIPELSIR